MYFSHHFHERSYIIVLFYIQPIITQDPTFFFFGIIKKVNMHDYDYFSYFLMMC